MDEKEIISNHFREMAKKSHSAVQKKYGKDFYKKIIEVRWAKKRLGIKKEEEGTDIAKLV